MRDLGKSEPNFATNFHSDEYVYSIQNYHGNHNLKSCEFGQNGDKESDK